MKHRTDDQYFEFNFVVTLDDISETIAGFHDLSGLSADGNKMGTMSSHSTAKIVLKRGRMRTDWFQAWRVAIKNRQVLPHGVTVVFRNEQRVMNIQSAWPTKIEGPVFEAASNNVEVETIELKGEGVSFNTIGSDD
jgi:phage tail-like protein